MHFESLHKSIIVNNEALYLTLSAYHLNSSVMDFNQPIYLKPSFSPKKVEAKAAYYDMIVFSPVRWNFIYQRPQHIVSRMAKTRSVLFVEMPIDYNKEDEGQVKLVAINDQITVLQAKVAALSDLRDIISSYVNNEFVPIGLFLSPI